MQFAVKIDQVEDFLKNTQEFDNIDSLRELLLQQEHHTKGTNSIPLLMVCDCVLTSWRMILVFLCILKKKNNQQNPTKLRTNMKLFYLEKNNHEITLCQASWKIWNACFWAAAEQLVVSLYSDFKAVQVKWDAKEPSWRFVLICKQVLKPSFCSMRKFIKVIITTNELAFFCGKLSIRKFRITSSNIPLQSPTVSWEWPSEKSALCFPLPRDGVWSRSDEVRVGAMT